MCVSPHMKTLPITCKLQVHIPWPTVQLEHHHLATMQLVHLFIQQIFVKDLLFASSQSSTRQTNSQAYILVVFIMLVPLPSLLTKPGIQQLPFIMLVFSQVSCKLLESRNYRLGLCLRFYSIIYKRFSVNCDHNNRIVSVFVTVRIIWILKLLIF